MLGIGVVLYLCLIPCYISRLALENPSYSNYIPLVHKISSPQPRTRTMLHIKHIARWSEFRRAYDTGECGTTRQDCPHNPAHITPLLVLAPE